MMMVVMSTGCPLVYLDECRVQVDVVRHDDGADDANRLQQLVRAAVLAVEDEESAQHLSLVRSHHHVLHNNTACLRE